MNRERRSILEIPTNKITIAPSILAADFANLGKDILAVTQAGADLIHVDVMDGHFVPNISFGAPILKAVHEISALPYDVHLMISEPEKYIADFANSGADHITVHLEIATDMNKLIEQIKKTGCTVGISLKPKTPVEEIFPYLDRIDLVLLMSVEPGFGGQSFMPEILPKFAAMARELGDRRSKVHFQIDGGINSSTAKSAVAAGANMMVAGTSVFAAPNGMNKAIAELKGQ